MFESLLGFIEAVTVLAVLGAFMFVAVGSTATWLASLMRSIHERQELLLEPPPPLLPRPATEQHQGPDQGNDQAALYNTSTPREPLLSLPLHRNQLNHSIQQYLQRSTQRRRSRRQSTLCDVTVHCEEQLLKLEAIHADQIYPLRVYLPLGTPLPHNKRSRRWFASLASAHQIDHVGHGLQTIFRNPTCFAKWPDRLHAMLEFAKLQACGQEQLLAHLEAYVCSPAHEQTRKLRLNYLCMLLLQFPKQCPLERLLAHIGVHGPFECWLACALFVAQEPAVLRAFLQQTQQPTYVAVWHLARHQDSYRTLTRARMLDANTAPARLVSGVIGLLQLTPAQELQRIEGLWELLEELLPLAIHRPYLQRSLLSLRAMLNHPHDERERQARGRLSLAVQDADADVGALSYASEGGQLSLIEPPHPRAE